jgi:hypothetical protein
MQRSSFKVGRIHTAEVKYPPPSGWLDPSMRKAKQSIKSSSNPGISLKLGFPSALGYKGNHACCFAAEDICRAPLIINSKKINSKNMIFRKG